METTAPLIEDLWPCFQGIIPAALSTCSHDGTTNITFIGQVYYIDATHVAISFLSILQQDAQERPRKSAGLRHDPRPPEPPGLLVVSAV